MKIFQDGQFTNWFGLLIGALGGGIGYLGFYVIENEILRYLCQTAGLLMICVSSYEAKAVALGLRPFEKFTWRAAKQTYWPKVVNAKDQQTCADFIANLCLIEQFIAVKEDLISRWGQGVAPAMLFGGFGKQLVTNWNVLSAPDRSYVCDLIEKAFTSGGEQLKSMVRLGLLNSLAEATAKDLSKQPEILAVLGEQSRTYVARLMHGASS